MALTERLAILIDASSSGAVREFQKLSAAAGQTDTTVTKTAKAGALLKGAFGALGLAAVAGGMAKFANASTEAASALEEAESKAQVVFGSSFPKIAEFAEETANAFNLSERAAYQFAGAFAPVFKNAGFGADAVADLSAAMTAFVADFASFNDLSIEEAFQKIQSGLAGETEAVRRYGIDVSAANVQQEAYAMGIAEVGDKLTETQKIQARTNIILRMGGDAMGDVERTAESLANRQRELAAAIEDAQASIGSSMASIKADLYGLGAGGADALSTIDEKLKEIGDGSMGLADILIKGPLWRAFENIKNAWSDTGDAGDDLSSASGGVATGLYETAEAALRASLNNEDLADSADLVADAAKAESDAIDDLASAIEGLGSKFSDADAAQDDLTASIRDAREPFQNLRDAQKQLADATTESERADARKAVSAAKAALTVKGNSKAALENRDALRDLASKTLQSAAAFTTLDGDTQRAAAETRRGRVAFIEMATQLGMTKAEANKYADQLGLIPKNVRSNVALEGVAAAKADAAAVRDAILSIPAYRQVEVVTKATRIIGASEGRASGGPVSAGRTYMVGEQGPELLKLQGSNGIITPNSRTPAQQAPQPITYNIYAPPDEMLRELKAAERRRALRNRMAA